MKQKLKEQQEKKSINLLQETKDLLYAENDKTMRKEIKDDTDGERYYVLELEE